MILPVIHQQMRSPTDTPTAFHMSVVQTTTHTFTLLAVEHSRDTSWPTHDFDLEGVLLVEGPEGLEGMATQAHFEWAWYAMNVRLSRGRHPLPSILLHDGQPMVWIEAGGHGIHGDPLDSPLREITNYATIPMTSPGGLWTDRAKLFVQDAHGKWRRGGAHAPWSWCDRIGYPGLVAFDPARFVLESGVQGWSPISLQYTHNPFLGV